MVMLKAKRNLDYVLPTRRTCVVKVCAVCCLRTLLTTSAVVYPHRSMNAGTLVMLNRRTMDVASLPPSCSGASSENNKGGSS